MEIPFPYNNGYSTCDENWPVNWLGEAHFKVYGNVQLHWFAFVQNIPKYE